MAKTTSVKKTYKKKMATKPKVVYVQKAPVEMKEINTSVSGAVPASGYIISLNNIGQGSDTGQRIGRAVKGGRLYYNGVILGASASGLIDYLRVILIYDSQSNGASPSYGDFLESGAGGNIVTMIKNTKGYPKRFTFLRDMVIPVQNQSSGGSCNGDKEDQAFSGSIDLSRYAQTRYSGASATVPLNGHVFLYVASYQNTGVVTTSAGVYANFKYTYSDD